MSIFALGSKLIGSLGGKGGGGNPLARLGDIGGALGAASAAGYNPYTATTVKGTSQAADADKKALDAQYQALDMTRANTNMGINDAEKNNLNLGINKVNQNTAARSNALKQEAAGRGLGGSGMDFALRAQNEQTGANAANAAGIEAQQTANQRALTSIAQLGALGGDINDQQFNRGQAADAFINSMSNNKIMQQQAMQEIRLQSIRVILVLIRKTDSLRRMLQIKDVVKIYKWLVLLWVPVVQLRGEDKNG